MCGARVCGERVYVCVCVSGEELATYLSERGNSIYAVLELVTSFVTQHQRYIKTPLLRSAIWPKV